LINATISANWSASAVDAERIASIRPFSVLILPCNTTSEDKALDVSVDTLVFKEDSAEIALDSSVLTSATRSETSVDNAAFKDTSDD